MTTAFGHRLVLGLAAGWVFFPPLAASSPANDDLYEKYTLEYAHDLYERLYRAGHYGEAVAAGKLVLDLLLQQPGQDDLALGRALARLGAAQRLAGESESAITNYGAAVDALRSATHRLDPRLLNPLLGLGRAYRDAGNLPAAVAVYEQTLHVQQVNYGPHSLRQSTLLLELSEIHRVMGDNATADELQVANVNLTDRHFPGDDVRRLPAMYKRAEMLRKIGDNIESQRLYRRAIGIVERAEGRQSLTLLEPLENLSEVFLYNQIEDGFNGPTQARRYLDRAIWIVEHNEDTTDRQKAEAYVRKADFLSLKTADHLSALQYYREAWELLSADPSLASERDAFFAKPVPLNDVPDNWLPTYEELRTRSIPGMPDNGIVIVHFDTDASGRAENFRVLESQPSAREGAIVVDQLKRLLFRPVFIAGEPADSADNEFKLLFQYLPASASGIEPKTTVDNRPEGRKASPDTILSRPQSNR